MFHMTFVVFVIASNRDRLRSINRSPCFREQKSYSKNRSRTPDVVGDVGWGCVCPLDDPEAAGYRSKCRPVLHLTRILHGWQGDRCVSGGGQARAFPKKALGRKWLIINEIKFEKLNAMDRQCPGPPFILAGVKWQQASEEGGGGLRHRSEVGRAPQRKCAKDLVPGGTRRPLPTGSWGRRPRISHNTNPNEKTRKNTTWKKSASQPGHFRAEGCPKERTGEFCSRDSRTAGKFLCFPPCCARERAHSGPPTVWSSESVPGYNRFDLPAGSRSRLKPNAADLRWITPNYGVNIFFPALANLARSGPLSLRGKLGGVYPGCVPRAGMKPGLWTLPRVNPTQSRRIKVNPTKSNLSNFQHDDPFRKQTFPRPFYSNLGRDYCSEPGNGGRLVASCWRGCAIK